MHLQILRHRPRAVPEYYPSNASLNLKRLWDNQQALNRRLYKFKVIGIPR